MRSDPTRIVYTGRRRFSGVNPGVVAWSHGARDGDAHRRFVAPAVYVVQDAVRAGWGGSESAAAVGCGGTHLAWRRVVIALQWGTNSVAIAESDDAIVTADGLQWRILEQTLAR